MHDPELPRANNSMVTSRGCRLVAAAALIASICIVMNAFSVLALLLSFLPLLLVASIGVRLSRPYENCCSNQIDFGLAVCVDAALCAVFAASLPVLAPGFLAFRLICPSDVQPYQQQFLVLPPPPPPPPQNHSYSFEAQQGG